MLSLHSPAFHDQGRLPVRYTCEGGELSPPLRWTGMPRNTASTALILEDEDAANTTLSRPVGVHWVVFNLPPGIDYLPEGADVDAIEDRTGEGLNDRQGIGYLPPCPGQGRHRFVFRLYALDTVLTGLYTPRSFHLEAAMSGHLIELAELTATFERSD